MAKIPLPGSALGARSPRPTLATFLVATPLASLLVAGCKLEPEVPEQRHSLNSDVVAANVDLAASERAQANLAGALDMLYGSPAAPSYLPVAAWIEDGYDPNAGGYDELAPEEWDALVADNEEHFARQLAAIDAGNFDDVSRPLYSDDLWARWQGHLALLDEEGMTPESPMDPEDPEFGTWTDEAKRLWTGFYPTPAETAEMYRVQCAHCHGTSGGGDGSTAEFLNPLPRDYRPGIFKFTALKDKARPRRQDLARILREGVYTTAMPSFARFSEARIQGLVDHVRLLSRRGETEILLADTYEAYSEDPESSLAIEKIQETYQFVHDRWPTDDELVITYEGDVPAPTPESIARGKKLFLGGEGEGANCASCHGTDGRGFGPSAKERDVETEELVWVKDEWGNEIRPRNLTKGEFRFGRRPIDLFRRVYAGINGTPMPAHLGMQVNDADGNPRELGEDDLWDIVHYVQYLGTVDIAPAVQETAHRMAHEHGDDHDHSHDDHSHDDGHEGSGH